jgi:hypothetical protein
VRFTFEIAGEKLVERDLLRIAAGAEDARPAFDRDRRLDDRRDRASSSTRRARHASGGWRAVEAGDAAQRSARRDSTRASSTRTLALRRSLTDRPRALPRPEHDP